MTTRCPQEEKQIHSLASLPAALCCFSEPNCCAPCDAGDCLLSGSHSLKEAPSVRLETWLEHYSNPFVAHFTDSKTNSQIWVHLLCIYNSSPAQWGNLWSLFRIFSVKQTYKMLRISRFWWRCCAAVVYSIAFLRMSFCFFLLNLFHNQEKKKQGDCKREV